MSSSSCGSPSTTHGRRSLPRSIQEEIYYWALSTSNELAEAYGPTPDVRRHPSGSGALQFDLWGVQPSKPEWADLRNASPSSASATPLLIAIAPTATIASICAAYECIEPQLSNLFKRETLSGEFLQINNYLVDDLKPVGCGTSRFAPRSR